MSNNFVQQRLVFFNKVVKGFSDQLVASRLATLVKTDQTEVARAGDTFWRPIPYIGTAYQGLDQTLNFVNSTQMAVPASLDQSWSSPFKMDALELRDPLQLERLATAASEKLASVVNAAVLQKVNLEGTLFVKRTVAASGFTDVAEADAVMNETGVSDLNRRIAYNSRDYNSAAANLQVASRSLDSSISSEALRKAYLGDVASFGTFKLDYQFSKTAAAGGGGITISTTYTTGGAGNYSLPAAMVTSGGQASPVDNRRATFTFSSTTNMAAGDSFTIANVFANHRISKAASATLKTFKVIQVLSSTTAICSPPLFNAAGLSQAEQAYGNVSVAAQSGTAAVVFLNTVTAPPCPIWIEDAVEIYPGRLVVPEGEGVKVMRASTPQGIEVVMSEQVDINTLVKKARLDILFGVGVPLPEMCGQMMFNQT